VRYAYLLATCSMLIVGWDVWLICDGRGSWANAVTALMLFNATAFMLASARARFRR